MKKQKKRKSSSMKLWRLWIIEEPTRKENTLDLVFTNDINIFTQVEVTGTIMSDLNIIEITTTLDDDGKNINNKEFNVDTKENYL